MSGQRTCLCPCGNLRLYFVTGLGYSSLKSSISDVRKHSVETVRNWLNVEEDYFSLIINKGKTPGKPHATTVKEIQDAMQRGEALCQCGKITNVFIGHSHGATCLREALLTIPLYPQEVMKLTQQMALFSIGGLQIFPRHSAKVSSTHGNFLTLPPSERH